VTALAANVRSDLAEGSVGGGTNTLDRRQTYNNDERQHHGVLNSRRTIFGSQETLNFADETLHENLQTVVAAHQSRPSHKQTENTRVEEAQPSTLAHQLDRRERTRFADSSEPLEN
jgi:hypothetical protein